MAERNFGAWTMHPDPVWTDAAANWPLRWVSRETEPTHLLGPSKPQWHLVCGDIVKTGRPCGQSVHCAVPDADAEAGYMTTPAEILAGVMDHIRKCHETQVITGTPAA